MTLSYDFNFPPTLAGLTAVITDESGNEYASEAIPSEVGRNGAVTLSVDLDERNYYLATASPYPSFTSDTFTTVGIADIPASIAAGGGGGVVIDADSLLIEINGGATVAPDQLSAPLIWDTLPEGVTIQDGQLGGLAVGLYHCSVELDFTQPAENRTVSVMFNSINSIVSPSGPFTLSKDGGTYGHTVFATGDAIVREGGAISVSLATSSLGAETPANLTLDYAALTLTPVLG